MSLPVFTKAQRCAHCRVLNELSSACNNFFLQKEMPRVCQIEYVLDQISID